MLDVLYEFCKLIKEIQKHGQCVQRNTGKRSMGKHWFSGKELTQSQGNVNVNVYKLFQMYCSFHNSTQSLTFPRYHAEWDRIYVIWTVLSEMYVS